MEIQSIAELMSLALTFPTVVLSVAVVLLWGKPAVAAWKRGSIDESGWFIVGVVLGFVGSTLDNVYWSVPWTAKFFGLPEAEALVNVGVFFNIFFRQGLGIGAAYCHLRAAREADERNSRRVNQVLMLAHAGGVVAALVLMAASGICR